MPYKKLVEGIKKFQKGLRTGQYSALYTQLVQQGQSPDALIIACSDSRIDPAIIAGSDPGDFFAIRNVAAIVPPYKNSSNLHGTSAAIEFAVRGLKIKHIIVMGHALCGGVRALANGLDQNEFEFLSTWLSVGHETKACVESALKHADEGTRIRALEQAIILTSLKNLMSFPWIEEKVKEGKILLHGWYFDMPNGKILAYDEGTNSFMDLAKTKAGPAENKVFSINRFIENCAQSCCHDKKATR